MAGKYVTFTIPAAIVRKREQARFAIAVNRVAHLYNRASTDVAFARH
jgi:hypothetical protein